MDEGADGEGEGGEGGAERKEGPEWECGEWPVTTAGGTYLVAGGIGGEYGASDEWKIDTE